MNTSNSIIGKSKFNLNLLLLLLVPNLFIVACNNGSSGSTPTPHPTTGTADTIEFSPTVTLLNNPVGNTPNNSQKFTVNFTAFSSNGSQITPSANNPLHVNVYGAPNGVITPESTTSSNGSVTFTYNGKSFPNNISINAWIADSTNKGAAIGVTQALMQNKPISCNYGNVNYPVHLTGSLPGALQIKAAVGTSAKSFSNFTIDTGSLGVIVPEDELIANGIIAGPGATGVKYYDSSGNTYSGNYYLAPVVISLPGGNTVLTQPILVLGINKAYCSGPKNLACYSGTAPTPNLHYMGVGFNRNSSTTGDLFNSPTANAFLHITDSSNGTDITPGYYLTPGDSGTPGLILGISDITNYNLMNLTPNPAVPGDFNPQSGCYSFPNLPHAPQFCGTMLLDVGIDYMFLDLPKAEWPSGSNLNGEVPSGVHMNILMGSINSPAMSYNFTAESNPPANAESQSLVKWVDTTNSGGNIFVNTGRRPLYQYNYLYNGQCGQVGFKALP